MEKVSSERVKAPQVRIMVVDDHPNIAATLARAISQLGEGMNVVSATSGRQALELANQGGVDVLITDMMMPGMNGLELIERLQAHPGGRPMHIILMTAYDVPGLRETTRRLRVHDTLIKPIPTEHICQIVKQVIDNMGKSSSSGATAENPPRFKIMIADDIPDNVTLLSRYMNNEGFEYVAAKNGVEVLQKARLEMPDLILLDVNMPEKDGFTALKELRADAEIQHIPVIILTAAHPNPGDIQWGLNLGADDYITKPFDKRELLARIRTKLRVKQVEDLTRRRNRELSILPEIARELSAHLDVSELLEVALRRSVETLGAIVGQIITFTPNEASYKEYRVSASGAAHANIQLPPLENLVQQINENRASLIIEDTHEDERWPSAPDDPTRSVILVPIVGRLDLLGLLILLHEQPQYFNLEHQILLQAIASQVSIAMENARLYTDLMHKEQKLAAVLQNAADAILMFDPQGRLSLANPAGRRLFTNDEVQTGQGLLQGVEYESLLDLLSQTQSSSVASSKEIEWPDQRVFSASATPIQEGGCVVVLHDVTHFKHLEKVKNEFIATASHDLRNPMASIKGFSSLLEKAGPLNQTQDDFVKRIQHATDHMSELIENMLDLAKIELDTRPKQESIELTDLLWKIVDEFQPQVDAKRQLLIFEQREASSKVQGDELQLRQVLRNLMGNAIKYTSEGGVITLSLANEGSLVNIKVKDTGYGIPSTDLPHIFERFYRVRNNGHDEIEGNGLGLAIVKSIVEQHGGSINVESELTRGTCFTIRLPLVMISISHTNDVRSRPMEHSNH